MRRCEFGKDEEISCNELLERVSKMFQVKLGVDYGESRHPKSAGLDLSAMVMVMWTTGIIVMRKRSKRLKMHTMICVGAEI